MALFVLLIGVVLIVTAIRDTQGDLFDALKQDVPDYSIWAAAILAIGAIGFVPGLKTASRGLLALVVIVLIVNNYERILKGFNASWQDTAPAGSAETAPDALSKPDGGNIISSVQDFKSIADQYGMGDILAGPGGFVK